MYAAVPPVDTKIENVFQCVGLTDVPRPQGPRQLRPNRSHFAEGVHHLETPADSDTQLAGPQSEGERGCRWGR